MKQNLENIIFPKPKFCSLGKGTYYFGLRSDTLYEFWQQVKNGIENIKFTTEASFSKEEYEINASENGIIIKAASEDGMFRGVTTFRQMVLNYGGEIPCCTVHDYPDFSRRSYMLDISRDRIPKVETIKQLVAMLAELKYNEFQLYMESFCFKFEAFPEYAENFEGLTAEDIQELEQYCAERFIELVPNQNSFGHMQNWVEREELKQLEVADNKNHTGTINPLAEETLKIMDKIYGSLFPYFKSEYANIGMDEAVGLGKYQLEEVCKKYGNDKVFFDYLNKLNDIASKYGKKIMFWDDMIVKYESSFDLIPKDATAMHWAYDLIPSQMMEDYCRKLAEKNIRFYVCPGDSSWNSFTGRTEVMTFNLRTASEVGKKYGAAGYMLTHWGDGHHPQFLSMSYIACALGGQYAWNTGEEQNGEAWKRNYIAEAKRYADVYMYKAEVSKYVYRLGEYYLYEPERIHNSTMSGISLNNSLDTKKFYFFDMSEIEAEYYFKNVVKFLQEIIEDVSKISFDEQYKREILLSANMALYGAKLMIFRENKSYKKEMRDTAQKLDNIAQEYRDLWNKRNFETGGNDFIMCLKKRSKELLAD